MTILISSINWLCVLLGIPYVASMVIYPVVAGDWSWGHVHSVWYAWQALNTGVLAFFASFVALNAVKYGEEKKRQRSFIASRAFLPQALSDLCKYFNESSFLLNEAYARAKDQADKCKTPLESPLPKLPEKYKEVFKDCISEAEPRIGKQLAYILMRLQIHQSRMEAMYSEFSPNSNFVQIHQNIMTYIFCLAELQALVNQLFGYARGVEEFDDSSIEAENFFSAYRSWDIDVDNNDDLKSFTERNHSKKWNKT